MPAKRNLTQGSIPKGLLAFALPLILGNLLQQCYNLADTWVVGRFIGEGALAAVDEKLNDHGYIVPGLGDAGDRIFGTK